MSRVDVELSDVLDSVADRLRQQLGLSESTCFFSLNPDSPPPVPTDVYLVISPDGGQFDPSMFEGGGEQQLTVETGALVTIHSTTRLDAGGKDKERLTNTSKGILQMMTKVLRALSGYDLTIDGDTFARTLPSPQGFSKPTKNKETLGSIGLAFNLSFDWDVSE